MSNIALQIERTAAGTVMPTGNVIFDVTKFSSGNVSYNPLSGVITFNEVGRYAINWWVSSQASASTNGVVFALKSSQSDFIEGTSPNKTGEVSGVGIINVVTAPVTLSLVNASTAGVAYSNVVPIKASLMVIEDDVIPGVNSGYFAFVGTGASQTVPFNNPFSFNTTNSSGVMTLTTSNTINVNATGRYVISYGVTTNSNSGRTIGLKINGILASDTPINVCSVSGAQQMISATIIKNLLSTDTVQLVTAGASTIVTNNFNVAAYVTIFQIS